MTSCWRWRGPLKAILTVCLQGTGMGQAQSGPCTGPYSAVLPMPAPPAFAQALLSPGSSPPFSWLQVLLTRTPSSW